MHATRQRRLAVGGGQPPGGPDGADGGQGLGPLCRPRLRHPRRRQIRLSSRPCGIGWCSVPRPSWKGPRPTACWAICWKRSRCRDDDPARPTAAVAPGGDGRLVGRGDGLGPPRLAGGADNDCGGGRASVDYRSLRSALAGATIRRRFPPPWPVTSRSPSARDCSARWASLVWRSPPGVARPGAAQLVARAVGDSRFGPDHAQPLDSHPRFGADTIGPSWLRLRGRRGLLEAAEVVWRSSRSTSIPKACGPKEALAKDASDEFRRSTSCGKAGNGVSAPNSNRFPIFAPETIRDASIGVPRLACAAPIVRRYPDRAASRRDRAGRLAGG